MYNAYVDNVYNAYLYKIMIGIAQLNAIINVK